MAGYILCCIFLLCSGGWLTTIDLFKGRWISNWDTHFLPNFMHSTFAGMQKHLSILWILSAIYHLTLMSVRGFFLQIAPLRTRPLQVSTTSFISFSTIPEKMLLLLHVWLRFLPISTPKDQTGPNWTKPSWCSKTIYDVNMSNNFYSHAYINLQPPIIFRHFLLDSRQIDEIAITCMNWWCT